MTLVDHLLNVETCARDLVKAEVEIGQLKNARKDGEDVHPDKIAFANQRRGRAFHKLAKALDDLSEERRWSDDA